MNPFKNYSFGRGGVNRDKSPLHLTPEELTKAQNIIRDTLGVEGGLKNRPGYLKLNAVAAAGITSATGTGRDRRLPDPWRKEGLVLGRMMVCGQRTGKRHQRRPAAASQHARSHVDSSWLRLRLVVPPSVTG